MTVDRYVMVDDLGQVLNPMIVNGQQHGGVAQGIGQALYEHAVYDRDSAQLVTGIFMDYVMPRADMLPNFEIALEEVPLPDQPDRREGHRRVRHHRRAAGGDQRGDRCALPARHRPHRHAGDAGPVWQAIQAAKGKAA